MSKKKITSTKREYVNLLNDKYNAVQEFDSCNLSQNMKPPPGVIYKFSGQTTFGGNYRESSSRISAPISQTRTPAPELLLQDQHLVVPDKNKVSFKQ